MSKTILIAGGSGLVGRHLTEHLLRKKYRIRWLSRNVRNIRKNDNLQVFLWEPGKNFIDKSALENVDVVINLAGQNIAGHRWTDDYKMKILASRVQSSHTLAYAIEKQKVKPELFIGASAVGFYGMLISDKIFYETDPPANDFFGKTCSEWERSYRPFDKLCNQVAVLRIGLVLSDKGGFLPKAAIPVKWGLGMSISPGCQILPMIHIDDLCRIFEFLIENTQKAGLYNAVGDMQLTYDEMVRILAKHFRRPLWSFRVPEFVLKLIFGEQHKMLTTGVRVSNEKLKKAGFELLFNDFQESLKSFKL
ncbi:MAG: epimerase [Vicingaceae bacterium]|nr:MAG: epimerase [Vicingaceae bacterium]